jgi:hypothetical protein
LLKNNISLILTSDKQGNLLKSTEDVVAVWFEFLKPKFAATEAEAKRDPLDVLPTERTEADSLTRAEFDAAIHRMADDKAVGPHGVPVEAYKYCPIISDKLFDLINHIWEDEAVPASLAMAKFIMLFKQKGSVNDPRKYRCIGLLNHEYKILSCILLNRML